MASTTAEILEGIPHQMKPSGGIANVCKVCSVIIPRSPYKCQVCGIYIHKKCLESLQPRCIAVAPKDLQDKQVKAGYIQKAGESSGVMARMQKRFIVLTTDGFLYYFADQNSPTPKGVIDLVNFSSTQAERSKGFKVSNPRDSESRAYVFQADSSKDQESWIQAITASTRQAQDNRDRILQDMRNSAIKTSSSERRMHRNLFVKVAEARNLPAMDITGTSDPYCLIRASQTLIRTSTIWNNNKNPLWGEQYDIVINDADANEDLAVTIYDEDFMSADDLIGQVKVPMATLKGQDFVEKWFKVAPLSHSDITGDLHIQTSFNVSEKTVKVKVIEARNLKAADMNGFSDPYVKVNLGKSTKKTKTIKKNLNPFFNEEFSLKYTDYNTDNLKLTVWDWDLVGSDDFLGQVLISISSLPTGVVDEWYPLKGNTGSSSSSSSSSSSGSSSSASSTPRDAEPDLGEIRLKLKYTEDLILPSDHYYPLAGLMYQYVEMSLLLGDVCKEKADVSKSLVSIYEVSNQSLRFVDALTSHEINNTPNPDIIFRGNSAVTKGVDFYMKMVGRVYLQKVLGTFITEQYDQKRCFEVDPAKADKGMDVKKNAKQIELLAESLITRIFSSVEDCPSVMRAVFKNIQATVAAKYPAESIKIVKYTAVTGFLFLRFFVPAILSPKLFNLMDSHPSPQTSRNLTIIGKVVQNLANLVPFGDKEPYMAELNPFILRNLDRLKTFVDSICDIAPERVVESSISSQNVEYDKEMAYCLRYFSTNFDKMAEKDPSAPFLVPLDSVIKSLVAITNQPL